LDQAISLARPQDTILAAGRGHETQQDFAGEVIANDDREVLRQSLVDHGFITHGCASTEDTDYNGKVNCDMIELNANQIAEATGGRLTSTVDDTVTVTAA